MSKSKKPEQVKEDPAKWANKVWIELEKPRDAKHAEEICEQANRLLQRLDPGTPYKFFWAENKAMYGYGHISFTYLSDRGTWLNLDYLGRPLDQTRDQWESSDPRYMR